MCSFSFGFVLAVGEDLCFRSILSHKPVKEDEIYVWWEILGMLELKALITFSVNCSACLGVLGELESC